MTITIPPTDAPATGAGTLAGTHAADARIRDSMPHTLPMTFLTGMPYSGQRRLRLTPTVHLLTALISAGIGLTLSYQALVAGQWWLALLVPGWAMTLHGARNLRMMVYHQCAHRNMWGLRRTDAIVGKIVAALLMVQDFGQYKTEHVADHHALHHMTLRDPTVQAFLVGLELQPRMSRRQMWRRVLGKLASPRFHARFALARIRSYLRPLRPLERTATITAYAAILAIVIWQHEWLFLLVGWILPMTVLFQISNTLRLCVKHTFPSSETTGRRGKEYFASLTNAIFFGEPAPARKLDGTRPWGAWTRWWLRILFIHFPARYLIVTGDTVVHDYHHRHPMSRDWANYIFARHSDAESGHRGWPQYHSVWGGLVPAINTVFDSLAAADPEDFSRDKLAEVSDRETFTSFDD